MRPAFSLKTPITSTGRRLMTSMAMWVSSSYFSIGSSQGFAFGLLLAGAPGHEVL
jgi:hypothetical protein